MSGAVATDPVTVSVDDEDDDVVLLKERIESDPENILMYLELIKWFESKDKFEQSREVYETLHQKFPFYSALWTIQLKSELQRDEFEIVEKLLSQCLSGDIENSDLDLWMTYLDYVRRRNNIITGGQEARAIVIKAFDLVLEKCAVFEPHSSQFWSDYLGFLEQWKPVNKWEEQQRIDLIRNLYKTMFTVPFNNLEKMWARYTQWEQNTNNLTARKFIGDISAEYMKSRSNFQEWSNVTTGLKRSSPATLSMANRKTIPLNNSDNLDVEQIQIWIGWIDWEKENKLVLSDDKLKARMTHIYKQSIQYMLFAPEIWYNYSMYLTDVAQRQKLLSYSVLANPDSPSLTFKLVECYELTNENDKVQECFDKCTQTLLRKYQQISTGISDEYVDSAIYKIKRELTFVCCIYMNTMKRLTGLSAARAVFGKCRKWKRIMTHDIYIENAYLEFQNQNDYKTAFKVLELGLKYFQDDGKYINKYLDFLILLNKDSQIKTLFESSVNNVKTPEQLKLIYKKMISYESKFGNLNNVYALEERFFKTFPNEKMIETFTDRYQIQNENLLKKLELPYIYQEDKQYSDDIEDNHNPLKRGNGYLNGYRNSNKRLKGNFEIPPDLMRLLSVLPKRQYFKTALLDSHKLLDYLNNQIEVPQEAEKH